MKDLTKNWKPIKDYENLYEISEDGEVYSVTRNIVLQPEITFWGYKQVMFSKKGIQKGKAIHKLVAEAFIGPIPEKFTVNHKDLNKLNNHYSNLEIISKSDNTKHYFDLKYGKDRKVYKPSGQEYKQREKLEIDSITEEVWKPIFLEDFKEKYEVSNYGNIRLIVNKVSINTFTNRTGYFSVNLSSKRVRKTQELHRLIAEAFLGPLPEGFVTNHIDGNKLNNHITNLEYITKAQNTLHNIQLGKANILKGSERYSAVLSEDNVRYIRENPDNLSGRTLAEKFGVHPSTISNVRTNKNWTHI